MSSKMGRPTEEPKRNWVGFRLSEKDIERLNYCSEKTGLSKAEIVRRGISVMYDKISQGI